MTQDPDLFAARHNGPRGGDIAAMLDTIGADSLTHLIDQTVPKRIRQTEALDIGRARSEAEALTELRAMAALNTPLKAMIGQGYHGTHTPPVIQRNVLENPGWYTAYTPYQPEISQGRLEALITFQTMITDLTGMDIANASLLDEATAAAEAMAMAQRVSKSKATAFFCDHNAHPQTIALLRSRAAPLGWTVMTGDPLTDLDPGAVFGALFQYPGTDGEVRDFRAPVMALHDAKALAVFAADPLALTLLTPPGELGADIAIGTTQRFGVPMGMGGPHAAYFATRDAYKRSMPGRLVGVSVDARGRPAYRLALQTREQHIRREKATSNICTAQVLLAVMAAMYAVWHGPEGLTQIAKRVHRRAATLAMGLRASGFMVPTLDFFDTITVIAGARAPALIDTAHKAGIALRDHGDGRIGIACDETTTEADVEALWRVFGDDYRYERVAAETEMPPALRRSSAFLTHPVFERHRSETDMMRFLRKLMDRDLALDRAMIPLGSCTMKLNAAAEMMPVSWPEFADVHPFLPEADTRGTRAMIDDLSQMLLAITGYDAISMQPNSGAQGEFAGLMAIRRYHESRGEGHRTVCLIPSSAHGTNPASAQMAGMSVIVVKCDDSGNVDLADLTAKAEKHSDTLAACMITYPSTHGVFEEEVRDICETIHAHGGQVYLDGANLNAQVGLAQPGQYGADVSHLNLHKTFCIPHGGGGPGMGPIGVKAQLAPFLPGAAHRGETGAISAAPFGSPLILPISWMYCRMMGGEGLTQATEIAILNANYIARRLETAYTVLYHGRGGRVAHECILDVRPFKDSAGVTVEDFAKRLIDYGFHAPTMSWPVTGTLMIEPTESESKAELDRFCDAMLAIRAEIAAIERGAATVEDSPLRHAPHTIDDLVEDWNRPYTREQGVFPPGVARLDKYWAPVGRVDNVHGDRNLVCACPPLSAYNEAAE